MFGAEPSDFLSAPEQVFDLGHSDDRFRVADDSRSQVDDTGGTRAQTDLRIRQRLGT